MCVSVANLDFGAELALLLARKHLDVAGDLYIDTIINKYKGRQRRELHAQTCLRERVLPVRILM